MNREAYEHEHEELKLQALDYMGQIEDYIHACPQEEATPEEEVECLSDRITEIKQLRQEYHANWDSEWETRWNTEVQE